MKRTFVRLPVLLMTILFLSGLLTGCPEPVSYQPPEPYGALPDDLSLALLQKGVLSSAVEVEDGFLVWGDCDFSPTLQKYGFDGSVQWTQTYDLGSEFPHAYIQALTGTGDGGFAFLLNALNPLSSYGGDEISATYLYFCDADGDLLDTYAFPDPSSSYCDTLLCSGDGGLYAVRSIAGLPSLCNDTNVCISRFSPDRVLMDQRTFGTSGMDDLQSACYQEDLGLVISLYSDSINGLYSDESGSLYDQILLLRDDLSPVWKMTNTSSSAMMSPCVLNGEIYWTEQCFPLFFYPASYSASLNKVGPEGSIAWRQTVNEFPYQFSCLALQKSSLILIPGDSSLSLYQPDGTLYRSIPLDGQYLEDVLIRDNYFLTVSCYYEDVNISSADAAGEPLYDNTSRQIVTGYDHQGELLFRCLYSG